MTNLYVRFRHGVQVDQTEKTGIILAADHFNNKNGSIRYKADFKDKDLVSKKLDALEAHLKTEIKTIADQETLPKDWLKTTIDKQ